MSRLLSRLRRELRRIEEARETHLETILDEQGPMRTGSFVSLSRKCGKPNCHCVDGEGHPAHYLSTKHKGRTRMHYVPKSQTMKVSQEAERYRRFRRARAELAKLANQALKIIDELEQALHANEPIGASKKKPRTKSSRKKRSR